MVLLRDKLYPKYKEVVQQTLAARQSFQPFAILPRSYGPFSHPVGGVQAVVMSRGELMDLRHAAQVSQQAPCLRRFLVPHAVYNGPIQGPMPGYGVHNVNYRPIGQLPPHARRQRQELFSHPAQYNDPRSMVAASHAAIQARQAQVNVLLQTL